MNLTTKHYNPKKGGVMQKKSKDGFKVAPGYGLVVNIKNQTLRFFKDYESGRVYQWPGTSSSKLYLIKPIMSEDELAAFMDLLSDMFFCQHLLIKKIQCSPSSIVCYYDDRL